VKAGLELITHYIKRNINMGKYVKEQPKEWICKSWGYHDYIQTIHNHEIIKEVCTKCGDRQLYNKTKEGWFDEKRYARRNRRKILQPLLDMKEDFIREYGDPFNVKEDE